MEASMRYPAIICDLDKTLCLLGERDPYDSDHCDEDLPNMPIVRLLEAMHKDGIHLIFVSGRKNTNVVRYKTKFWLKEHVPTLRRGTSYLLLMRDPKDDRADHLVKKDMYQQVIEEKYEVLFVVDDRPSVVRMWRYELGLTVLQLNDVEF